MDPGNIVHATDANGLLVITQIQPISVIFTIAEDQLPAVLKKMRAGQQLDGGCLRPRHEDEDCARDR